jgi:predicted dehydrogenase
VCDTNDEQLEAIRLQSGALQAYSDYQTMLEQADIQAVVIATPMPFHAPMAIAALERGLHVLSEVPAAISVTESKALVSSARRSAATYMMAENYTFMKPNMMIRELVAQGMFGETYYAEGEYLHELKEHNEQTPWRRQWQTGINGITYPTHSLGPILQWMPPGDRVVSVCCVGSGHHYQDARGERYENEDSCVMLCRMAKGGLVKIRVDMLSNRPHAMTNYSLQGTDGAYESARSHTERNRIWLRSRHSEPHQWAELSSLEPEFTPEAWRDRYSLSEMNHGGVDQLVLEAFRDVILRRRENDLDIHHALDMTLPGLISQQSIAQDGCWLEVPDSRLWVVSP